MIFLHYVLEGRKVCVRFNDRIFFDFFFLHFIQSMKKKEIYRKYYYTLVLVNRS